MNYPVAEKIFERCLGSPLTSEQEIEVRELLKAMSDADWPVEEPTSAAFLTIVGFFYARAPSPIDAAVATDQISQALKETTAGILREQIKPVIHLDFVETFKKSFVEAMTLAISRTALAITGALLVLTAYGTHQIDAHYMQSGQQAIQTK
ncbi:hypothetical protein [Polynucleobacter sp. Fuers-14]|uniref:hypothetical protein n=1 Tax=Polynucleobacter sp. Fuers-14 TaxID=1758364 RepID=UPI001C0DD412|nr:hypothetical protein [Polynucleobacter sp. Fuers-14]MBU3640993.1 hypothetical protein [Polynucleobacter sp. Fuers-14]